MMSKISSGRDDSRRSLLVLRVLLIATLAAILLVVIKTMGFIG